MSDNTNVDIWIAGAFAAFTVDLIVYPLDTIKTRFQSPDYLKRYTNGAANGHGANRALFRGVYQGVGSTIIATLPSSGAFFTTYEGVKAILEERNPRYGSGHLLPQPAIHAMASGTAELVSCAILTPAEVIKQNAQMVDNGSGNGNGKPRVNATLQTIQRFRANPLALWRGYTALAGRNLPFTALQFPMFERIKESIRTYRNDRGIRTHSLVESGLITAASAGIGGSIAAVVTTPVDVVKTRIMLAAAESAAEDQKSEGQGTKSTHHTLRDATGKTMQQAKDSVKEAVANVTKPVSRKSSMQIAREIIQEHGVKGLFRGGALRAVWTLMGSGLYLGVYESGRVYLADRRALVVPMECNRHRDAFSASRRRRAVLLDPLAILVEPTMPSPACILGVFTFAAVLARTTAQSTEAPIVTNNPAGVQYVAQFPANSSGPSGAVVVSSAPDGMGVNVQIVISNLPSVGGPFRELGALDAKVCDSHQPKDCQIGDLSGKHGTMNGPQFSANYIDKYISLVEGATAFVGNRSIIILDSNYTRIACANLTNGESPTGSSAMPFTSPFAANPTSSAPSTPSPETTIPSASAIVPGPMNQDGVISSTVTITVAPSPLETTITSLQTPADVTQVVSPPATTITMVSTPSTDLGTTTIFGQPSTVTITAVQTAPPLTQFVSVAPDTVTVVELQSQA
nr:s-adenosylmethionine mitochondrial carrier protein [Quercus suber]